MPIGEILFPVLLLLSPNHITATLTAFNATGNMTAMRHYTILHRTRYKDDNVTGMYSGKVMLQIQGKSVRFGSEKAQVQEKG